MTQTAIESLTPAQVAGLPGFAPSTLRIAANRCGGYGGVSTTAKTDGTVTGATYRTYHQAPASGPISDIVAYFANWFWNASAETSGDNAITVKAYLEYAGVSYPYLQAGVATLTIQPGGEVKTDPIPVTIPAGAVYYTRVYVTSNGVASGTWPLGRSTISSFDSNNYGGSAADVASGIGGISGGATISYMYGPTRLLASGPLTGPVVGLVGDSIAAGVGDFASFLGLSPFQGFLERGLANTVPWVSMTRSSYRSSFLSSVYSKGLGLFGQKSVTTVIDELGVNDVNAGTSLAALQALKVAEWFSVSRRGPRVIQTTITPRSTSTDGWTTLANQTVTANEAVRTGFNDWVRAGAPILNGVATTAGTSGAIVAGNAGHPLGGYLELADSVESSRNSGKWAIASNARTVTDAATTSGSNNITSATAAFTSADVGSGVLVIGAGASGGNLITMIQSLTSATVVVGSGSSGTTTSGATLAIGGLTNDGTHAVVVGILLMKAVVAAGIGVQIV